MKCDECSSRVSREARAECRRLHVPYRCSRCLCEFLMPRGERSRRARLKRRGGAEKAPKSSVLRLVESLTPRQLELYQSWKSNCIDMGVPVTPYDKLSYLSELMAA